ncbi:MAG: LacI family DNA-binding transcriptional regulator [Faecousia sp.]
MTIKDLAKETGYSVGTISRVLNGQPNVSERARRTILAYVEKSGFQLNANAKQLRQTHGDGILAVVTGRQNELFAQMIEHIQRLLTETQYPLTVDYVDESEDAVQHALRCCREKKPLGILFLGGDTQLFAQSFGGIRVPSVLLTSDASALGFRNLSSVTTDDIAAAQCAVEYLFAQGHRRIGIINGDLIYSGLSWLRYEGCRRAFAAHGMTLSETQCATARYSFADGYAAAQRLVGTQELTAIFAMSDVMAIGAMRALRDSGLRVPEDISVVGFDGLALGEYYIPKLTTIRQDAEQLARRGVELLLQALEEKSPARHEKVPFELAVQDSVKRLSAPL